MHLQIVVSGSYPGRSATFWSEVEAFIGVMCGETGGALTRIARPDGRVNYRDYGVYELTYTAKWSTHYATLELR